MLKARAGEIRSDPQDERPSQNIGAKVKQARVSRKRKRFDMFGPKLSYMSLPSGNNGVSSTSAKEKALADILKYEQYHKGYLKSDNEQGQSKNQRLNEELKENYDKDPRLFWANGDHSLIMGSQLASFASYVFSILASSAGSEREFSRMGYLLSPRRSRYTASNTNKRLTLSNLIPQKNVWRKL